MSTASPGLSSLLPAGSALPVGDRHRVATGDGTRLHAIVAGAGTPLVLTHGRCCRWSAVPGPATRWQTRPVTPTGADPKLRF
jgi:hypothetical protein